MSFSDCMGADARRKTILQMPGTWAMRACVFWQKLLVLPMISFAKLLEFPQSLKLCFYLFILHNKSSSDMFGCIFLLFSLLHWELHLFHLEFSCECNGELNWRSFSVHYSMNVLVTFLFYFYFCSLRVYYIILLLLTVQKDLLYLSEWQDWAQIFYTKIFICNCTIDGLEAQFSHKFYHIFFLRLTDINKTYCEIIMNICVQFQSLVVCMVIAYNL